MTKVKVLTIAIAMMAAGICQAATTDDLAKENEQLKQRVGKLEKELQMLKEMVMKQSQPPATQPAPAPELKDSDIDKIAAKVQEKQLPAKLKPAGVTIEPYGYIKLDAMYDDSKIDNGNLARWVESEVTNDDDDQFNMTANQTRLGIKLSGPEGGDVATSGLVEVDFFGNAGATNKASIMMRHAYLNIAWPGDDFSILAGQTWDVFSPLNPYTLNYSVAWWAGNIGYRRPQIRLTKKYSLGNDIPLKLEGAITRAIGDDDEFTGDTGEDAGVPGLQARVSTQLGLLDYKPTTIGVSGHWSEEEWDEDIFGNDDHYHSWSVNLDVLQPVNDWLNIKGEVFTGENLSSYLGGIGQGVNLVRGTEIASKGGWVAAGLGPWDKWNFNVGASIEDLDSDDLAGMDGDLREYNRSIFGNAIYSINSNTMLGFELSHWETDYRGDSDSDSIRAQTSFIYKF